MQTLFQDLRYGFRMILKNPSFTILAVLTLALGICANTTIFSLINGLVLRPLAGVKEPERLVAVYTSDYSSGVYGSSSYPDYVDFRDQSDAFTGLATYQGAVLNIAGEGDAERLRGAFVTGNFFDVLGVSAKLGRTLQPTDEKPQETQPMVISYGLWQRRFNSDPATVGRSIKLNERYYTVVGVADESFRGLRLGPPLEFWIPLTVGPDLARRGNRGLEITGRLKPGVTAAQAQSQLETISARLAEAYPETNRGTLERPNDPRPITVVREMRIEPSAQKNVYPVTMLLLAVVGLVLLIACANVANLLVTRAAARRREIAIRLALGARRSRLIRQLLTESMLLALLGAILGLTATLWTSQLLPRFVSPAEAGGLDLSMDWRVLTFTAAIAVLTAILFGLAPSLQATRPNLVSSLKEESISFGRVLPFLNLRDGLVIAQLALSLVLLIGAGLFVRSLRQAVVFDPGFATENLLLASLATRGSGLSTEQGQTFYQELTERVSGLPGVKAVSLAAIVPLGGGGQRQGVQVEGYQPQPNEDREINTNIVGKNFFTTLGIPVVQGRDFVYDDKQGSPGVVVVNEEFARRYFPGQSAVGKRLKFGSQGEFREIVGVVRSAKYRNLREDTLPFIYIPLAQQPRAGMSLIVRTANDPVSLLPAVRAEVQRINKGIPIFGVQTMTERISAQLAADRMIAVLLSIFGGAALLLAAVGVYGVMGYSVAQRTHEIGIRMALGADRPRIFRLIARQALVLISIGAFVGLALAFALTRVVKNMLFGVSATDPLMFGVTFVLLIVVAFIACYVPARRATKVDPLVALRYE